MNDNDAAVEVSGLTFTYPKVERPAISDVNLRINRGSVTGIMGNAGCGKSTLCLTFNGLIPNFVKGQLHGEIRINGQDIRNASVSDLAPTVGLLFQDFEAQLCSTSAELEIAFGPENYNIARPELVRRVEKYLELMELAELRRRHPTTLSGGQQQRLAIASILALEPDIVVMDEPTTDLDSAGYDGLLHIANVIRGADRTLIIAEHDAEILTAADNIILISDGSIVSAGAADEILRDVELLNRCGVTPPQLAELFYRLGIRDCPLTVKGCLEILAKYERRSSKPTGKLPGAGQDSAVALQNVTYKYPDTPTAAVCNLSLQVLEGEFLAIIGENGSGKTTVALLLSGLLTPGSGEALLFGVNMRSLPRHVILGQIGCVFQNPDHQIFCATVAEEVSFAARHLGVSGDELDARVAHTLRIVGLQGYDKRDPFGLTKGERQRVAVASALVTRPRVIILDEPTTGLDRPQHIGMMNMLAQLNESGHTVIIVTHSMSTVAEYSSRTVILHEGSILIDGATRDVLCQEEVLAKASLQPPPIVQLSNKLGTNAMSVTEMVTVLQGETGRP